MHQTNKRKNFFELITEIIGWISIALSPLLIGALIGIMIYSFKTTDTGLFIAILFACAGLITGVIWATRVWMKTGTIQFLSKLISSGDPENKTD